MFLIRQTKYLPLLAVAACSGASDDADVGAPADEPIGASDQAIIGGMNIDRAVQQGFVQVNRDSTLCSGTLLQNDLVMTAKRCTTMDGTLDGPPDDRLEWYSLFAGRAGRGVARIFRHATEDVALLQLDNFFPAASGQKFDFERGIYSATNASLVGRTVRCYGYGSQTILSCSPQEGWDFGSLREADLTISSTTATRLYATPTAASNAMMFTGDNGGSCLFGTLMTGVYTSSNCTSGPPIAVTRSNFVGADAFRSWATDLLHTRGVIHIHKSVPVAGIPHTTAVNHESLDGNASANFHITANFNPNGAAGITNNAHTGIFYDGNAARWKIFNQGRQALPANAAFNWWKSTSMLRHTADVTNIPAGLMHVTRINGLLTIHRDPNQILIVTQRWDGVYNNRAVGVWFDTGSQRWHIYNEDGAPMLTDAKFNVSWAEPTTGAFVHTSTAASVSGSKTVLSNHNIDGEPNAQFVVTHNFKFGGGNGGIFHNHPVGVRYDSATQRWAIYNLDGAPMPVGITFNVAVRP